MATQQEKDVERSNVACPVWPDAQEVRMLRALVREGVASMAAARHELYAVQFHGWCVWVWRHDDALQNSMQIDIRSRDGDVWARLTCETACHVSDEVA
ncbi:hypothetical protein [Paraburkholderia sp. EG304]|uniref:hypothetical protein n=1 Tax=Paraburkholderia sp. EG304 TaxID=3237015 RepID=UPI00397B6AAB